MGKIISDIYRGDTRIIRLAIRRDGATITGRLNTTLAPGSATSIIIDVNKMAFPIPPPQSGHIVLTNPAQKTQTIAYSAWTEMNSVYTFTVSDTVAWDFDAGATVATIDPARVDITGAQIVLTVKKDTSLPALITKTATITNAGAGEATIELTPTDTDIDPGEYYYDIQMTDSNGNVTTLVKSILTILQEVTI